MVRLDSRSMGCCKSVVTPLPMSDIFYIWLHGYDMTRPCFCESVSPVVPPCVPGEGFPSVCCSVSSRGQAWSCPYWCSITLFNTLRPRQNGRHFADDTFKRIFLNDNGRISIKISLKFVLKGPINNNPSLVQIMAWRRSGDKPLSEPMMVSLLTHICVTRPQWVNQAWEFSGFTPINVRARIQIKGFTFAI